jgi:type I restriction enzyme, S subunit
MKQSQQRKTKVKSQSYSESLPMGWNYKSLGELGTFSKGKGILKEQVIPKGLPCIRYGEIYTTHDFVIRDFKSFISSEVAHESQKIKKGDILFAGSGETIEDIGKAVAYVGVHEAYAGGDVIILSTNGEVNSEYISYTLNTDFVNKQKRRLGQGQQIVHIYPSDLAQIIVAIPPISVQNKITNLLTSWNNQISVLENLIAKRKVRKYWLAQHLLTGKLKLIGYEKSKWREVRLGDVTRNFSRRNKNLISARIYSVTNYNGFMHQNEHFSREVAGEDLSNYKIIKKGEFAYNPARINVGSIAYFENEIGLISSLYVCFKATDEIDDYYLFELFDLDHTKYKINAYGEGGVRIYLWYDLFAKIKVSIPDIDEQLAICNVLKAADKEIELLSKKVSKLREFKKGLIQQLLTGKMQLKV